ncbi:unique cartilage matrix-associated protein isoform X3 [Mastomys coucha]|uniref:unique cartilage matrix-associated protein isoform X3 n=1 Tax=Mastomys coucha TaxID=35658 RepID=UPI00126198F8|nr:unique cartilage matrix-associated protein isoform X3 [Mastomys coucha]
MMSWRQVILLSSLSALVLLCKLQEGASASVGSRQAAGEEVQEGTKQIFMQESDASNFLKRRSKRSPMSRDEVNEQEERTREAVEQWRQWHYDGLYPPYLFNRQNI